VLDDVRVRELRGRVVLGSVHWPGWRRRTTLARPARRARVQPIRACAAIARTQVHGPARGRVPEHERVGSVVLQELAVVRGETVVGEVDGALFLLLVEAAPAAEGEKHDKEREQSDAADHATDDRPDVTVVRAVLVAAAGARVTRGGRRRARGR
jgi:hypothetical protein